MCYPIPLPILGLQILLPLDFSWFVPIPPHCRRENDLSIWRLSCCTLIEEIFEDTDVVQCLVAHQAIVGDFVQIDNACEFDSRFGT